MTTNHNQPKTRLRLTKRGIVVVYGTIGLAAMSGLIFLTGALETFL